MNINFASAVFFEILDRVVIIAFKGIFHRECAVRPPSNKTAAIPDDAVMTAISSCERTPAVNVFSKNVLPGIK